MENKNWVETAGIPSSSYSEERVRLVTVTSRHFTAQWFGREVQVLERQGVGQAKIKQRAAIAPTLIEEWEADDCVTFSVALTVRNGLAAACGLVDPFA